MSTVDLFWNLNVSTKTKYILIFIICLILFLSSFLLGKKKIEALPGREYFLEDELYKKYKNLSNPTKCQKEYISCIENYATKQNYYKNCIRCKKNGKYPKKSII